MCVCVCVLNYTISLLVEPDARNYSWRRFDQLSGAMRTLEKKRKSKNTRQISNPPSQPHSDQIPQIRAPNLLNEREEMSE